MSGEGGRYVLLVPAADAGGISTWVRGAAVGLRELGRRVQVVRWYDLSSPYSDKNREVFEGLPVVDVTFDGLDKEDRVAGALDQELDLGDGDRVISGIFQWISPLIERVRRDRSVVHVEVLHGDAPVVYRVAGFALPTCDLYGVMHEGMADELGRRVLAPHGVEVPVVAVPGGVEVPPERPATVAEGAPSGGEGVGSEGPLKILYLGRISEKEKRVADLVPVSVALGDRGVDHRVTVVGPGDADFLRRAIRDAGVEERFALVGRKPHREALALFDRHHVWVQTSPREGAPIALCEAMAWGAVPVATRVGNCPEIIRDGENGFLVDPGDVEAMADRIEGLARDRDRLARMAEEGRRTARRELSVAARARTLVDAVEAVAAERGPGLRPARRSGPRRPLESPWLPNWAVRGARRVWRLARGRPDDVAGRRR